MIYSPEKVQGLISTFEEDAHLLLLFLRHVDSIEVYQRDAHSYNPKLVFKVEVAADCRDEVRQQRQEFSRQTSGRQPSSPVVCTFPVTIVATTLDSKQKQERVFQWLVTNYYVGGQTSATFRKLQMDPDLHYPPWVGVAMPLAGPEQQEGEEPPMTGHVFCVLPLPIERGSQTGLPVEVNGYFALEQNRKYVKWPTAVSYRTREDLMDKRLLWNQCMLKEALPKAYASLLKAAISLFSSGGSAQLTLEAIYAAFPDLTRVDRKWDSLLPNMYADLFKEPVVYTRAQGGHWIHAKEAIFDTLEAGEEAREVILEVLAAADVKVASVPMHVQDAIRVCCMMILGKMTPALVSSSFKQIQYNTSLQWETKVTLLKYFLRQTRYDLLDGLDLLPLANGGFCPVCVNARKAERFIYLAPSQELQELFPGMEDHFVDFELAADVQELLKQAAQRGEISILLNSIKLSTLGIISASYFLGVAS